VLDRRDATEKETGDWKFHPSISAIVAETHARPSLQISPPARILHFAFRCNEETTRQFFSAIDGSAPTQSGPRHRIGRIGNVTAKLERHTEFMSLTLLEDEKPLNAKDRTALDALAMANFPFENTEMLVMLCLTLHRKPQDMLKNLPVDTPFYGGCLRDDIDVRSTFRPNGDGFVPIEMTSRSLGRDEIGRRVQRLMEMETYRTMALLGLSVARGISSELSECENELERLTTSLRETDEQGEKADERLFSELSALSERANVLQSETRFRFAASRAYHALFQQRVASLEESKVGDIQTMSGFLRSRVEPAMATIESNAKRQQTLLEDIYRALTLLRTRIELGLNKGNQALLQSMDRRHLQQLKISQTVEGLSIVAITYYAVGLVSYLLKALAQQSWMPFSEALLTALSVPAVLALVWFLLKRVRRAWEVRRGD